ncbi:hypothetical protein PPL_05414 [Heterostelium album PN500]|uniref:E3 ubiquitin-protein ligase n=1 Tax=Heterostelium pallidum (strain ATCC 26659 / Pp 5 / PN500) TaxID=670386 RepID=D3BA40_HETP5|nr:hypothetical protein PPL_05414 [Heterostelium album PN500]EFA81427.1 hypothetical protein PPL_05414 [Heterostelium album PN500]|eukprot:XP_020433545.1 hypothetical protein PPL_05414 [Heterostelium album PN500]
MEDHQNESTSKAAKFEELLKKTVAQLKVIVMNFEESHDKRFKIPTRKNEIIQLIIDNDMYKSNDHDFEKRTKPSTKRSLIDNESDNNNNNNNDEEQLLYNNDDDDDEKEEGEDEEVEQDEDEDDSMMEGEGEEQQKQQQRKQHNKQTTTTTTTTSNINIKSIVVSNNNNNKGQPVDLLKENADAWFNKVQSDVVTKKKLIRSFDDFDQRAENTTTIDDMFRYYFREKTSLDIFTTTNFPIHGTTRCSNYLFRRWHFICLTCSTVDIKYCVDCFLNGIHREENHRFSLVYTPNISCVCDCGDGDVMKTSSFCTKHRFATNIQQKENYINQFPEYLRDAFKTFFNKFESKMFSRLLKIEECAVYFSNNQMILKIFLDICQNLHLFASVAFKFENILRELKDLIHLESCLINGFNHMLQHLPEAKIQEMTKTIIDQAMDLSTKIKYPVYARDKGTRLLFPLPRIIALCVLHSSANNNIDHFIQLVKSDYEHYSPSIADMVFNITTFRAFYYAHCCRPRNQNLDSHVVASPTDDDRFNRFFTQKFMMLDFLMLQLSLISTGPSTFLYQLLNEPFSYSATNNEWLKVIFEIIVNVLQTRATIKPTEEDIEYHYIQAAASGYFYYSEMLNFKFIYKNIPMETKERIIAKVVKDVKAPKMQLKPEYWSRYDPYYWSFEYVFKIHLQELAKEEFTKYQRENNIPECFPSLPALLPPLDNKLDGIYQLFHENALYEFLHYTTMKIVYPNFKGFKDFEKNTNSFYANHNLFGKISTSDIIVINDIYYILLMALRHFDQWIVEQSDRDVRAIRHEVSQFLSNNNYKKHPQQRPLYFWETNNVVTMLLRAYTPSFKNIRKKQSQSFLDTLIYCWKINSTDQNPLLQEIMIWFGQFDDSINDYFETQGITDFDPKKREEEEREKRRKIMQAKRDEIMKQMKEKQNQFLQLTENQDLYDETEVLENNTTTSTTTTNNNNNNNNTSEDSSNNTSTTATATATTTSGEQHHHDESTDKICMICRDTTSTEPLYTVARVTNCTLAMNQKSTSLYKLIRSMPQSYLNTTIQNLLEHQENIFFDSKRFPKSSVHNFDFGFQCPQCNANSNILIPVDVANLTIEEVMKFFLNIQDAGEIDEVFERHFWGMVHSNIDVFEMKTRQISNYIVDTDQLPYYLLTDLEFKQELATLRILFKTITSCEVPPFAEDLIDVDDHLKFHVDPFFLSTYLVYLRKLDYKTTNSQSIKQYLFNYILMEAMKLPKFKVTQSADTIRQIYANLKDNQESLNSYLFPVLRKCYLYHCLASYPTQPALINQLSQQQFASFEYIKTSLNIGNTTEIISQTELEDFINRFSNLKKGFVSFIPSSYLHLPKLKKLQPKYIDFIIKNIPNTVQEEQQFMCTSCEKTQSFKCLSCGSTTCAPDCIHSFVSCPNGLHQVFLFIDITTGLLKVVDLDKDVILYNNDSLCVYFNEHNEPSTITNNQLTLSNKHLQSVYKKWVQMISTNTIQSMDIDLPNTLFL